MAVYVFDDAKNLFEGMTKEQIVNAIAAATGLTPAEIDADVLTSAIKEQNAQRSVALWVGSQAEYNAIQAPDENTLYIVTDPDETNELQAQIDLLQAEINSLKKGKLLYSGSAAPGDTLQTDFSVTDYDKIEVGFLQYGVNVLCVKTNGTKSPLWVSNMPNYIGSVYDPHDGFLYCAKLRVNTNVSNSSVEVVTAQAISRPFTDQQSVDTCTIETIKGVS